MEDINKMTISKLREMAKSLGLKDYEKLKKAQLLEMVMNTLAPAPVKTVGDNLTKKVKKDEKPVKAVKAAKTGTKSQKASSKSSQKPSNTKQKTKTEDAKAADNNAPIPLGVKNISELDSGARANGILEVMPDGFAFIRSENYMPGESDVYVSPSQVKTNKLRTGDIITGPIRIKSGGEKFAALLEIDSINGSAPEISRNRLRFEELTPIFPNKRIHLETDGGKTSMRIVDLISPIGMGQRGMIVSPPKAGKTTLIKDIAKSISINHPQMKLIILLVDERPEEVTDIRESINNANAEVVYSTFDEHPEHHKKVSEMVINRAKRLAERGIDVVILLDSITRLSRAYNLVNPPSGRTLSGGLDPNALFGPKKFFGAARNLRDSGSITILATALVETGSRMDEVIFEEFKGTGNMELVLDRKMSERRMFPAIDLLKSGTRRDDLLLTPEEHDIMDRLRKYFGKLKPEEQSEEILKLFYETKTNRDFLSLVSKLRD